MFTFERYALLSRELRRVHTMLENVTSELLDIGDDKSAFECTLLRSELEEFRFSLLDASFEPTQLPAELLPREKWEPLPF